MSFQVTAFNMKPESWLPGLPMSQIHDCTAAKNQTGEDSCMFIFWNTHNLETSPGYVYLYSASSQRSSSIDGVRAQTKMAANDHNFTLALEEISSSSSTFWTTEPNSTSLQCYLVLFHISFQSSGTEPQKYCFTEYHQSHTQKRV